MRPKPTRPRPPTAARKQRRALSHLGGPVELTGTDERERAAIERALAIGEDETAQAHVHGFHSYPARMHPLTARAFVDDLSVGDAVVLDPFCGSGTVLVEGRLAGRKVTGVDANPLAIELAWLKTRGSSAEERAALLHSARKATRHAENRRERRAGATHRYGPEDVALFEPHVLLELDGLRAGLAGVELAFAGRALALVLSSILVKVSRQPGDTAQARGPRRLAGGFTIQLFEKKAEELARRLAEFESLLPKGARPARVTIGDARQLDKIAPRSVNLVVTSPPYPGVYDYVAHHAARLRWLGLDAQRFAATELGARRNMARLSYDDALARWKSELGAALAAMGRVAAPASKVVLVIADSVISGRAIRADAIVRELAPRARLEVSTVGSQRRPHFHEPTARAFDRDPRREHVIVCRPVP